MATMASPAPIPPASDTPAPASLWSRFLSATHALLHRFFSIDLRALAVFRIGLALLLLTDYVERFGDLKAHYTEAGLMPLEAVTLFHNVPRWYLVSSPYMWNGSTEWVSFLMVLGLVFAVMLLVGWKTRFAVAASWFLLIALHTRNPMVLQGGDIYKRMLLFWSLFLPLGARYSLDGLAAQWVAHRQPLPRTVLSMGTVGILLQVCFVYWFNAIAKSAPEWRTDFTAVYYALNLDAFTLPLGEWLRQFWLPCYLLTVATILLEAFGPFFAFSPWKADRLRVIAVAVFLFFHLVGIGWFMDVGPFIYVASVPWVLFLPTSFWDALGQRWERLPDTKFKTGIARIRERFIGWRSEQIAARIRKGEPIPRLSLSMAGNLCALFFLGYVVLWNLRETKDPWLLNNTPRPSPLILWTTRVDQFWGMFAPRPQTDDGWFVVPATTLDGITFDLFRMRAPVTFDKPKNARADYKNDRWRKYFSNLWDKRFTTQRPYYCRWLAQEWNQSHNGPQTLAKLEVCYMREDTLPFGKQPKPVKCVLYTYHMIAPRTRMAR